MNRESTLFRKKSAKLGDFLQKPLKVGEKKDWPNNSKNKCAQVTPFIIVAIVIIAAIILGALFLSGGKEAILPKEVGPEQSIRDCIRDAVRDKIRVVLDNGGVVDSTQGIVYQGVNYHYLCYQANYYSKCINLYPALEINVEEGIRRSSVSNVQACFNAVKTDLEDRGFTVGGQAQEYTLDILPGGIKAIVKFNLTVSDGQTSSSFENFDVRVPSSLYEFINLAREIVNSESENCNYNYARKNILNPRFSIERINYNASRLYIITDRVSEDTFKFAVRGCVL